MIIYFEFEIRKFPVTMGIVWGYLIFGAYLLHFMIFLQQRLTTKLDEDYHY